MNLTRSELINFFGCSPNIRAMLKGCKAENFHVVANGTTWQIIVYDTTIFGQPRNYMLGYILQSEAYLDLCAILAAFETPKLVHLYRIEMAAANCMTPTIYAIKCELEKRNVN